MHVLGIEIEVVKKNIKNIHLYVMPPDGKVKITAPVKTGDKSIYLFAASKMDWIQKQIKVFENRPKPPEYKFITGETHYVWGQGYRLQLKIADRKNVTIFEDTLTLYAKENSNTDERKKILDDFYRKELKEKLPGFLKKWEPVIRVEANDVGVKNMKTRWGTCNVKDRRIWINLQLAKRPSYCLEYVVVHELVHLLERNHGTEFKKKMYEFLPDWKRTKRELNDHVNSLKTPLN